MKVARSALGYRSTKAARESAGAGANGGAVGAVPRYGYHRIRIFLGRDGHAMSPGRAYRLWRRAWLQLTLVGGVLSALHASCA
jgi:putative transposase